MNMKKFALVLLTAALVSCGGGDNGPAPGNQDPGTRFSAQVSFGDSLADVGTYAVGAVAALGGGKFTINGDNTARSPDLTGRNFTELLAAQFRLPAPCPAQTGLQGDPARNLRVAVTNHAGCFGYAQGGARVSMPAGAGNGRDDASIGLLMLPVTAQVGNHLAVSGDRFQGSEIVFVTAGSNDVLAELEALAAGAAAAGSAEAASNYLLANAPLAIARVARAAEELSVLVRTQVVGKGANHVVVNNVPDIAATPLGQGQSASLRQLLTTMVTTFNNQLSAGLAGENKVLLVDLYTLTREQAANPAAYGLANTTTPACLQNAFGGSALACNGGNIVPAPDVGRYMFADSFHPTPYTQALAVRHILAQMMIKGWI